MCVIVHQPVGTHIEKEQAKRLWTHNSDGGGFAFVNNAGDVETHKFMEFGPFWSHFETMRSNFPGRDYLLHMRIATHGSVNIDNVHPFPVDDYTVMAHNGIIHGVDIPKGDTRSDTRVFVDEVLPELPENWLDSVYLTSMVEEWIGWSKLMFLTSNPALKKSVYILNERKGVEYEGMWFSNATGVRKPEKRKVPPATLAAGAYRWDPVTKRSIPIDSFYYADNDDDKVAYMPYNDSMVDKMILQQERFRSGLSRPIVKAGDAWECIGCGLPIDSLTGECKCWEMVCMDCFSFSQECECSSIGSLNLVHWDEAPTEVQEAATKAKSPEFYAAQRNSS